MSGSTQWVMISLRACRCRLPTKFRLSPTALSQPPLNWGRQTRCMPCHCSQLLIELDPNKWIWKWPLEIISIWIMKKMQLPAGLHAAFR